MKIIASVILGIVSLFTVAAPAIAPHDPGEQFRDYVLAPPMRVRLLDQTGRLRAPYVYPLTLIDRVERRYEHDTSRRIPLTQLVRKNGGATPVFLLGTDSLGRDILSRLVYGTRTSLAVSFSAVFCAILVGITIGGLAGFAGGWIDESAMRFAEFVLLLPAIYMMLALRAVLPLVLPSSVVFVLMVGLLAFAGWPFVARAVRAIVTVERHRAYVEAARAIGASPARVLVRHIMPSTKGVVVVQGVLLLPGFVVAEATLSFVGVGFPDPVPSWGGMLQEAANVQTMAQAPWVLAPAAILTATVLALTVLAQPRITGDILELTRT